MTELDQALQHHKAGRLEEAEAACRELLAREPEHADARHLLGILSAQRGDLQRAVGLIEQAIERAPAIPDYHHNLGEAYRALGAFDQAIAAYEHALALDPDRPATHYNLGNALQAQGNHNQAIEAFERAMVLNPNAPEISNDLGVAFQAQGKLDRAIEAYEHALALNPELAVIHHNLGNALQAQGKLDQAIAGYERALALNPDLPATHYNLGNAYQAHGRFNEAIAAYRRALALKPEEAEAHHAFGNALHESGQLDEAVDAYRQAIALSPGHADAHHNLGIVLQEQGKLREAMERHRRAIELDPHFAEAHNSLGVTLSAQGKMGEALIEYRQALVLRPGLPEAYGNIARARRYESADDEDADKIRALLDEPEISENDAVHLHFALGKIYDDCRLYDEAFSEYRRGNEIKHRKTRFDAAAFKVYIDRVIRTFDSELFAEKKNFGSSSELPVFIVGMPRSGTTLVEQIISSHPRVRGAGELDKIHRLSIKSVPSYPEGIRMVDCDALQALAREYESTLSRDATTDALRVSDKMPFNFVHLGFIAALFPRARIVHCVRHPFDVCLSIYFQLFQNGYDYTYDLSDIAAYYRQYERVMAHWRSVLPIKPHDVVYEDLVKDQKGKTEELIRFLELPWDDRCLSFMDNERSVQTASVWQVRQPVYRTSIHRWRHYEKHLGPLKAALGSH